MSSKNKRGPDTLLPSLFLLPGQLSHKIPVRMLLALSHSYAFCSGTQVSLIHGPPAHEGGYLLPVIRGERNALSELRFAKHTTAPCG